MAADVRIRRLGPGDRELARALFGTMARVFEEENVDLADEYIDGLLARSSFWALVAEIEGDLVGGLTAHVVPLTRKEEAEVFVYDVAVVAPYRRRGVGRALLVELRRLCDEAGIGVVFVAADDEDVEAHDFYRALGADGAAVTMFTFGVSA